MMSLLWFFWLASVFFQSFGTLLGGQSVNLQRARISDGYRRTLDKAFDKLSIWCVVHDRPLPQSLEGDHPGINALLVDHLQFLFDEQFGVSSGRHALLAVQTRMRSLRGHLTQAWDSMRAWEQLAPISLRVPIPVLVLEAMFIYAMLAGFSSMGNAARDWISFGLGLITSFDGLLRPGEWCALTARKVLMPSSRLQRLVGRGLLTISNGKNRRVFGRIQIAMVDSPRVMAWLSWLTHGMEPHQRLMPGGTAAFRRMFKRCVEALGLEDMRLSPASLRAGGATARFAAGMDLGQLK